MATHSHGESYAPDCVEIAPNVCLRPVEHSSAPKGVVLNTPEANAYGTHPSGFIVAHDRPGFDRRCEGHVNTDTCGAWPGSATWSQTGSLEAGDLTLAPSILCVLGNVSIGECGFHGWVKNGAWVAA